MDDNRILVIGKTVQGLRSSGLLQAPNFNEFDAIILDTSKLLAEVAQTNAPPGSVDSAERKIAGLVEWVSLWPSTDRHCGGSSICALF